MLDFEVVAPAEEERNLWKDAGTESIELLVDLLARCERDDFLELIRGSQR